MFIAHIIENCRHARTRVFNTDRPVSEIALELANFIGSKSINVDKEIILCDENNYPLEDTE